MNVASLIYSVCKYISVQIRGNLIDHYPPRFFCFYLFYRGLSIQEILVRTQGIFPMMPYVADSFIFHILVFTLDRIDLFVQRIPFS